MYNTGGLVYRVLTIGLLILIIGIVTLISSKFWKPQIRKTGSIILATCILLFSISYNVFFAYKAVNPSIATCKGSFVRQSRYNAAPFTNEYVFDIGTDIKKVLFLDISSKKNIYPDDFQKDAVYVITYEKDTDIILCIEKVG